MSAVTRGGSRRGNLGAGTHTGGAGGATVILGPFVKPIFGRSGADPGGAKGALPPPPPPKKFPPPNNLRQHNSQARIQGGQGGLAPPPYKILDPPMEV